MLSSFCQMILDGIAVLLGALIYLLPSSPFQYIEELQADNEFIGYLGYIVPFNTISTVLQAWLLCIVVYYAYSIVMRWIKMID